MFGSDIVYSFLGGWGCNFFCCVFRKLAIFCLWKRTLRGRYETPRWGYVWSHSCFCYFFVNSSSSFFLGGVVFIVFDFRVVFIVLCMPSLRGIGIKVGSLFFSRSQSSFPRHAVGIRVVFPDENTPATDYLLSWARDGWTSHYLYWEVYESIWCVNGEHPKQ